MPTKPQPDVVKLEAHTIKELQSILHALCALSDATNWTATRGDQGHASILVYNASGDLIAEIRNNGLTNTL